MASRLHGREVKFADLRKRYAWTEPHDNTSLATKISIRKAIIRRLNAPIHVLDAFCGTGKVFEAVYNKSQSYKGLDAKNIHSKDLCEVVEDNKMWVSKNSIETYNLFDLDAHTTPWEIFHLITRHKSFGKTHNRIGFVLTDGTLILQKLSGCSTLQRAYLQIPRRMKIPCLQRHYKFFVMLAFQKAAEALNWKLETPAYQAFNMKSNVSYMGVILSKH